MLRISLTGLADNMQDLIKNLRKTISAVEKLTDADLDDTTQLIGEGCLYGEIYPVYPVSEEDEEEDEEEN